MRVCKECKKDISNEHMNKKYCTDSCSYKARYRREGQRSTPEQRKEWYEERKKKDGYMDKLRKQGRERYYKVQGYLRDYKIKHGCKDCGYKEHHSALEFDHVMGNKTLNVCNSKSIAQAKEEIKKCEVVCSNCHKIRTYERLQIDTPL